jgi:hypothetical protein
MKIKMVVVMMMMMMMMIIIIIIIIMQEILGRTYHLLSSDTTRTAQKATRPTILLLLHAYSLPREHIYGAVA